MFMGLLWVFGDVFGVGYHVLVWSMVSRGFFFLGPGVVWGLPKLMMAAMLVSWGMLRVSRSLFSL